MLKRTDIVRSRIAIFGIFGLNGLVLSIWVVHIPSILIHTHTTHAGLGVLLLLLGIGAFIGMQAGGYLADRFGSRRMSVSYSLWIALAILPLALVTNIWLLGVALVVFGFGNGGLDVAMNLQAAKLEEQYKRPIMSAFHAFFSIGTFVGSLFGALMLGLHAPLLLTFVIISIVAICIAVVCRPFLLRHIDKSNDHIAGENELHAKEVLSKKIYVKVFLLGFIAFLLMLSEGVANDWSALQIKEKLLVTESLAALGYAAFAICMTIGRFTADTIAHRFGPLAVLRYGSIIGAIGMVIVFSSNILWLTLIGWGLFGLGLSGSVPQLFTAAGKISRAKQGVIMSRVVGMGYIGLLAGPAIIGGLSQFMPLTVAMLLPLGFMILAAVSAKRILNQ